jgi:hypothetical protein
MAMQNRVDAIPAREMKLRSALANCAGSLFTIASDGLAPKRAMTQVAY